eukprot:780200_1
MASRLEHSIEINDYVCGNIVDNEDDEKGINWKELDVIKNKITYFCDNLKDNKTYKIRTRCRNEYGYSLYSKQISFTTKKLMINIDSNILYNNEKQIFLGLMNSSLTDIGKTFKLIYRGSRDGWKSLDFHNKCDNKGKTVVLIYANTNNVFGAYRSIPWKKNGGYQSDKNAFLFLIRSAKGYKPQIFKVKQSDTCAVCDCSSNDGYMLAFGGAPDIGVYSGCNANNNSSTYKTGYSYQLPNTEYYLNGCRNFKVK